MNQDISNNKTVKLLIEIALSSAGIYALLFSFGFLSFRVKLNMLGAWTNTSLSQDVYVNETIASIPKLLAGLLISSYLSI